MESKIEKISTTPKPILTAGRPHPRPLPLSSTDTPILRAKAKPQELPPALHLPPPHLSNKVESFLCLENTALPPPSKKPKPNKLSLKSGLNYHGSFELKKKPVFGFSEIMDMRNWNRNSMPGILKNEKEDENYPYSKCVRSIIVYLQNEIMAR